MSASHTATKALTLIRTELQRLRPPGDLIPRSRLLDRLGAGQSRKLTLISAQAGGGKTTLYFGAQSMSVKSDEAGFPATTLTSEPVGQAGLIGMVNHLNTLGLPLVSVECLSTE